MQRCPWRFCIQGGSWAAAVWCSVPQKHCKADGPSETNFLPRRDASLLGRAALLRSASRCEGPSPTRRRLGHMLTPYTPRTHAPAAVALRAVGRQQGGVCSLQRRRGCGVLRQGLCTHELRQGRNLPTRWERAHGTVTARSARRGAWPHHAGEAAPGPCLWHAARMYMPRKAMRRRPLRVQAVL